MKISLITATYNSAATLKSTFKSVLSQTYTDIDYWVIDGGSTDGTIDIIKEYEAVFGGRMHYISEKDRGIYDAMNKGISRCTGDVVGILNSDDYFTSDDVLQNVAHTFSSNETIDAVYGDIHFISDNNPDKIVRYYSSKMFRPFWLRFGFMPAHPSFYVRREVYEKYGLYDLQFRTSSDFEWMVRLFAKHHIRAKYLPMDFMTMRDGGESTSGMEAKRKVNNDIVGSLRKHGIFTCGAFKYVRYGIKGSELIITKIKN